MTHITEMKKLIFIDACMRAGSRTRRIASQIIEELGKKYSVETVDLTRNMYPVADIICSALMLRIQRQRIRKSASAV